MAAKYVYFFGDGKAEGNAEMKNLLGGKGANLAEMTSIGLPVPPGFTITTEVCTEFYKNNQNYPAGLTAEVEANLKKVEELMGKQFGDPKNPLLVSVRSGARASMPGMMDTILNLGLNDVTVQGVIEQSRRRALRLRRLPPFRADVLRRGDGDEQGHARASPGAEEGGEGGPSRYRAHGRRLEGTRRRLQGKDQGDPGQGIPGRSRRSSSGAPSAPCSARG